jgi:hypothetical protein
MTLPNVTLTVSDGALGLAPSDVNSVVAIIGCSSAGTVNTVYPFTNPQDVVGSLGYGPLSEAVAFQLQNAGGTVYAVRGTTATAATKSAVSVSVQTGDGTLTLTGTPLDKYNGIVVITTSGACTAAKFKYSLDGGVTYSTDITVPTSAAAYELTNTGLSLVFTANAGSPVDWILGDTFTFTTTEPHLDSTNLGLAFDALLADAREWRFCHVVSNATPYVSSATTYTLATMCDTKMTTAATSFRYTHVICEARDQAQGVADSTEAVWVAEVCTSTAAFVSKRVSIAAGFVELLSAIPQTGKAYMRRSCAWPIVAQRVKLTRSQDSGFVAKTGALPGVKSIYHNEESTPGFDDGRFTTVRTIVGSQGYYCTHWRMMSLSTSDFKFVQFREVMDQACRLTRQALQTYLNADLNVNADGTLDETDASLIESYGNGLLNAGLAGDVSKATAGGPAASMTVSKTNNVTSTQTLLATTRVRPKSYSKFITADVGFQSPNLTVGA